jgi:uncharacterized membrane protein YphA (DoxX/SURF4 family)
MKLPHSMRVMIFLLRIALGLNFFYLSYSVLFNPALGKEVHGRSFGDLYSWLALTNQPGWVHPFAQWAFLIIGACLMVGLLTRVMSVSAIILTLFSYLPTLSYSALNISQFISDEVIVVICLFLLVLANAGNYIGLDSFIHIHPPKKNPKV